MGWLSLRAELAAGFWSRRCVACRKSFWRFIKTRSSAAQRGLETALKARLANGPRRLSSRWTACVCCCCISLLRCFSPSCPRLKQKQRTFVALKRFSWKPALASWKWSQGSLKKRVF